MAASQSFVQTDQAADAMKHDGCGPRRGNPRYYRSDSSAFSKTRERIPVTAAKEYGCKAYGFDIDPQRVKDSLANVRRHGVERLVTIKKRDIFTLDLSKGPTIVTLYLLPHLNANLLPQLRKLPPGARVISVVHRMADIKPDEHIVVRTQGSEFDLYLWKAETLRGK